jgi:hypothetical protein
MARPTVRGSHALEISWILFYPGFSFIAIATMALGVGATTAIDSVIDATLLHPLPYPIPSELI